MLLDDGHSTLISLYVTVDHDHVYLLDCMTVGLSPTGIAQTDRVRMVA